MSDLVQRLRSLARYDAWGVMEEAADEIERLQQERDALALANATMLAEIRRLVGLSADAMLAAADKPEEPAANE